MVNDADWNEQRLFIREELRNLRAGLDKLNTSVSELRSNDLSAIRIDIAMLQVKSGLWGGLAGALVVLVPIVVKMVG